MSASAIVPRQQQRRRLPPPAVSQETQNAARTAVRSLLEQSDAYKLLDTGKRRELANHLVQIGTYLAEPDGVRVPRARQSAKVRALADSGVGVNTDAQGNFVAQGAMQGAAAAGALLSAVNFTDFVAGLIKGVFHSIVQSSMEQMEAYAQLVANVAKSLNQFRDENVPVDQGRQQLLDQFPDIFQLSTDDSGFGDFGSTDGGPPAPPPVTVRDDVDEKAALARINNSVPMPDGQPLTSLGDDDIQQKLIPAVQTQIASNRQQLLATLVMMGINRVVVTDGKISAKVMYNFQAQDRMRYRQNQQNYQYSDDSSASPYYGLANASRDSRYYTMGLYSSASQPLLNVASASQTSTDASLQTKAQLAGTVEVNFKSDYLPLEKMATPENIAAIQMNAQPGMTRTIAQRPQGASGGAAAPTTATPASTAPASTAPPTPPATASAPRTGG